jgi:hypothetical protein
VVNTYTSYQLIMRDIDRSIENVGKQPVVERETAYYLENIEKVKSIDDFLADDRLYKYAMKAYGLDDMAYAKAFMRKVLTEGIRDSDSFANKLSDKRYYEFAKTFNFERFGETTTIFDDTRTGTVDKYMRQTLEEDAGNQNEGVRLALYFERKASSIDNFYQILADPALAQVVRTALGYPSAIAQADIDKQVNMMAARIDIEDFKDPEKVGEFLKRFTSLWELENPSSSPQTSIAALFSQPAEFGISTDLLLTMAQLKR